MADWSTLPYDILGAIALNFEDIVDCVYFRAVCHSFDDAYMMVKEMSQLKLLPWLFLAETTKENPECCRKMFSLSTKKCYQLSLPETFGRRCWGSNYGWIVTLGVDHEMHLLNPLTKARIRLPSQSTFPSFAECESLNMSSDWYRRCYVTRAIVLRIPDEFVVIVTYDEDRYPAFARLGDQVWTHIQGPKFDGLMYVQDICYWDGKIVVLYTNGRLGYCDINSSSPHVRDLLPAPPSIRDDTYKLLTVDKFYLVNSNAELLILKRYKLGDEEEIDEYVSYNTIEIAVFRPNLHTGEWTEINDLGDFAFFVGDNHSTSRNTLNSLTVIRNRIYFTDDEMQYWELPRDFAGHDMGAFDVGDKDMNITRFYEGGDFNSRFCTPFWFTPMI